MLDPTIHPHVFTLSFFHCLTFLAGFAWLGLAWRFVCLLHSSVVPWKTTSKPAFFWVVFALLKLPRCLSKHLWVGSIRPPQICLAMCVQCVFYNASLVHLQKYKVKGCLSTPKKNFLQTHIADLNASGSLCVAKQRSAKENQSLRFLRFLDSLI